MNSQHLIERIHITASTIGAVLKERGARLSCAESCTGGRLAGALTSVAGASSWFDTGMVTYSYESKRDQLQIPPAILDQGLVTEEVAKSMAEQVALLSGSDYAIATTGSCGPTPDEGHDPTYVWIGVYSRQTGVLTTLYTDDNINREMNMQMAVLAALRQLLCVLNDR